MVAGLAVAEAVFGELSPAIRLSRTAKDGDHVAASLSIEPDDFELAPFAKEGGLGKVHQLFGAELPEVLEALNKKLAA